MLVAELYAAALRSIAALHSLAASKIGMPVLIRPTQGTRNQQAVGSSFRSEAACMGMKPSQTVGMANRLLARSRSVISCGARPGAPASYGGWGSYSMASWIACATASPAIRPVRVSAMPLPADTRQR